MLLFVGKRLLMMIPTILGITLLIFVVISVVPGDPARLALGIDATEEEVIKLQDEMGLNDPLPTRYISYMAGVVRGDFGKSWINGYDVGQELKSRIPITLTIAFGAMLVQILIGLPVGIISAVKQYSITDTLTTGISMVLTSAPTFWTGLMLMLIFALNLGWLPAIGTSSWKGYVLPITTMAVGIMAGMIRTTRSNMLECIRQDYVRTSRAKGAQEKSVVFRDVLPNALMPIITVVGMNFGQNMGGAIVCETVFAMPGVGSMMYGGVGTRDMPVVLGCIMFMALAICIMNLVVDILYAFIDPRVKSRYMADAVRARRRRELRRGGAAA